MDLIEGGIISKEKAIRLKISMNHDSELPKHITKKLKVVEWQL